jgi:magnesium-transporting ATPase (P-type)
MYGFLSGLFSILFLIQIVFSIIIVSQKGTALEEVATYYSVVCTVLFLISCGIDCCVVPKIKEKYTVPACYSVTILLVVLAWFICWIYMEFVSKSLQTIAYPLQSIFMFGVTVPDFILSLRILNWNLCGTGTEEEAAIVYV